MIDMFSFSWLIYFNDMPTCLGLFYAQMLGNQVHCMYLPNPSIQAVLNTKNSDYNTLHTETLLLPITSYSLSHKPIWLFVYNRSLNNALSSWEYQGR